MRLAAAAAAAATAALVVALPFPAALAGARPLGLAARLFVE